MTVHDTPLRFVIGSREVFSVNRRLVPVDFSLDVLLGNRPVDLPASFGAGSDGFRFLSVPKATVGVIRKRFPNAALGGLSEYPRWYIDMSTDHPAYLARFSGKTRSTLKRKVRKLADRCGGALDIREYRGATEMAEFLDLAVPLSRQTYQARLLNAGLPESQEARARMIALAAEDAARAYLLFVDGKPASYLFLSVRDEILLYEHLGYDDALASFSPGTVLQVEALERLFAEGRFRYFDFTGGDGAHKRLFATHSVEAADFLLLTPSTSNRLLLASLSAFDRAVATGKGIAGKLGLDSKLRSAIRG